MSSFLVRDFLLTVSYRAAFALQLLTIAFAVPVIYFLSQVFAGTSVASLQVYGGQYFAFLLLGMAFQDYVTLSQSSFTASIREHQLMGTLEIIMLSPVPVPLILLCSSLWGYLFTSLRFGLYVGLGFLFGLDLSRIHAGSLLLIMILSVLSFAALGILSAAGTILIKRGEGLLTFLTAATLAVGGVAYPVSILPAWLQAFAQTLPFTHALEGLRKAVLLGASPMMLWTECAVLLGFAALLFPVALWCFAAAVHRAKRLGTLGQY